MRLAATLLLAAVVAIVLAKASHGATTRVTGTGQCSAACAIPSGFCKDIVTWSACTAGDTSNPEIKSESSAESSFAQTVAALESQSGVKLSQKCRSELQWKMCVFTVAPCKSSPAYEALCMSTCTTANTNCNVCTSELAKASYTFNFICPQVTTGCSTDTRGQSCMVSGTTTSTATTSDGVTVAVSVLVIVALAIVALLM